MSTKEKRIYDVFDTIVSNYISQVDNSLIKSDISQDLLNQLINSTILKTISKKFNLSKKDTRSKLYSYYLYNRKSKSNKKELTEKDKLLPIPKEEVKEEDKDIVLNEREKFVEDMLKKAPELERRLFKPVLIEYLDHPSDKGLININKILDRYYKLYEKSNPIKKLIPYRRPDWLAPKQHEIADKCQASHSMFVHGERQTGKDTSIAVGKFEQLITKKRQQPLFFMASKKDTAKAIVKKILAEDRFQYLEDHIHTITDFYILFHCQDGGTNRFQIIDTTESAVKGITGDLWVDDIDTIIKEGKEDVITKAIAVTRANSEIHFCFTSNMGKGAYINFLSTIQDPKWTDQIKIYELKTADVPHINAEKDEFLFAVMKSLSGEGEARAQLLNEYNREGDIFDPNSLTNAALAYEYFMSQRSQEIHIEKMLLSIDPSGVGHPIGWCIFAYGSNTIWEVCSGEKQLGDEDEINNEKITPDKLIAFFINKARKHKVNYAIIENNQNGPTIKIMLKIAKIKCEFRNFGGETNINSHTNKNRLVRHFLDNGMIVIKNPDLIAQLRIYNPFENKNKLKGDLADSFIHVVWELVGGSRFLKKLAKLQAKELQIPQNDTQKGFH